MTNTNREAVERLARAWAVMDGQEAEFRADPDGYLSDAEHLLSTSGLADIVARAEAAEADAYRAEKRAKMAVEWRDSDKDRADNAEARLADIQAVTLEQVVSAGKRYCSQRGSALQSWSKPQKAAYGAGQIDLLHQIETAAAMIAEGNPQAAAARVLGVHQLAQDLIAMGAHKCRLTTDEAIGWPDGLSMPNGFDDDERITVAHLDLEDSQYGPRLWDFAISALTAIAEKTDG